MVKDATGGNHADRHPVMVKKERGLALGRDQHLLGVVVGRLGRHVMVLRGVEDLVSSVDFWRQPDARSPEAAGIAGALLGSLMTILVTLAAALPLGLMAALYLEELAPRQRRLTRAWWRLVEVVTINLAATPSVVFGLLGLTVFLHLMHLPRSAPLVGGLVLALMALPLIIIAARNAIRTVPVEQRDAALALGASPMQVTLHHVLPAAFPGMITSAVLALAHVLGETAPLMLIGMVAFIASYPTSWLQPATTLPVQIYLWATSPEPAFASKAAAGVVVLLVLVLSLNALAQTARRRWKHRW
ncbi:MAG: phosphate ABC transporter permease PstA [Alphaproteobacteria bacterium]|nr:phosphate ABC transporter permease PstA [Alphaproteobacteria bacterium]